MAVLLSTLVTSTTETVLSRCQRWPHTKYRRWFWCLVLIVAGGGSSGCNSPASSVQEPVQLFQIHCARCHAQVGEVGGPQLGASQGPDLRDIGRRRSPEWIADYIRQPTNRRPNARMPAFAGQLSEGQIRTLADYLYQRSAAYQRSSAAPSEVPTASSLRGSGERSTD